MNTAANNDYRAAICQAAHAVASFYFGVKFQQVSIDASHSGVKHWKSRDAALWEQLHGNPPGKAWTEATIERKTLFAVCILYAGEVALQKAGLPTDEVNSTFDDIREFASALKPIEERELYLQQCHELTVKLIHNNWNRVQRVAVELQAVRKLTGKQVTAIVETIPLERVYNYLFPLGNNWDTTPEYT